MFCCNVFLQDFVKLFCCNDTVQEYGAMLWCIVFSPMFWQIIFMQDCVASYRCNVLVNSFNARVWCNLLVQDFGIKLQCKKLHKSINLTFTQNLISLSTITF